MRFGRLDRELELQSFTLAGDGDPQSGTWATVTTVWGERLSMRASESFLSQQQVAEGFAAYKIRYYPNLDPSWRIKDGALIWYVEGEVEGEGRLRETILTVSRRNPRDEVVSS